MGSCAASLSHRPRLRRVRRTPFSGSIDAVSGRTSRCRHCHRHHSFNSNRAKLQRRPSGERRKRHYSSGRWRREHCPRASCLTGRPEFSTAGRRAAGTFTFVAKVADASDASNSAVGTFTLTVLAEAPPSTYLAIADRTTREKGTLPALGPAGYAFQDPVFESRIFRITDGATRPGALDRSYRTPSSSHANAWSADGNYFYTVST